MVQASYLPREKWLPKYNDTQILQQIEVLDVSSLGTLGQYC